MEKFETDDFRSHTEACVKQACGVDELTMDEDGDWPIMVGDVPVFVRVLDDDPPRVQVFTTIASDVSPDGWAEINHLNTVMAWAKLMWIPDGRVIAVNTIHPAAVNVAIVDHALESVASYARDCGQMLETVFGSCGDSRDRPTHAPAEISSLPVEGVFVFGSGVGANHSGGAALAAYERFGAQRGVTEGHRGQSYAIPTMEGIDVFARAAKRFLRYAETRPELDFYLTRVGCGEAGFDSSVAAWLFEGSPTNVIKPEGW